MNSLESWDFLLSDIKNFAMAIGDIELHQYQLEVAYAILDSVINNRGLTFTVMFSRQAGKNEVSAWIEAYLLCLYLNQKPKIVKAAPTFVPQIVNSRLRLEGILKNDLLKEGFRGRSGFIFEFYNGMVYFFSASKEASIVGATAGLLLEIDESQDVIAEKYDKDLVPMTAQNNATIVHYGTAWLEDDLLQRQIQINKRLEEEDGIKRHFEYNAEEVAKYNPNYRKHLEQQIKEKGIDHPLIQTQYFLKTLKNGGKLFNLQRQAMLQGNHKRIFKAEAGKRYIALIDNAGEDEGDSGKQKSTSVDAVQKRDSTVCFIVELDTNRATPFDQWAYLNIVDIKLFKSGTRLQEQQIELLAYLHHWNPVYVCTDNIGVGAGTSSFIHSNYKFGIVEKYNANRNTKSTAGFDLLALVDTGHLKMFSDDGSKEYSEFWFQVDKCVQEFFADKQMNYFVDSKVGHDDFISCLHFTARVALYYKGLKWSDYKYGGERKQLKNYKVL